MKVDTEFEAWWATVKDQYPAPLSPDGTSGSAKRTAHAGWKACKARFVAELTEQFGVDPFKPGMPFQPATPGASEPTPYKRTLRCPHGVSELNHCTKCD